MSLRGYIFLLVFGLGLAGGVAASPAPVVQVASPGEGGVVRYAQIVLSGRVEGVVRLLVDGAEVAIEQGRFEAGPYQLPEGERAFLIHAEGPGGEVRQLVHRVVRDSRAPRLSMIRPRPGTSLRETKVELVGSAVDRHLLGVWVAGEAVAVDSGRFRHQLQLAEGWQEIELRAIDAVGNETVEKVRLRGDRTPPELWLAESTSEAVLEDGARYGRAVHLAARASEGELRLRVDGRPWDPVRPVVEEGDHIVEVVAVDAAGNEARRRVSFSIDRTAPRFRALAGDGAEVAARQLTLEGRVEGAATVEVGAERVPVDGDGRFRVPVNLREGRQAVAVVARDSAGNRSSKTVVIKSDTVAPVVTIASPAAGAVVAGSPIAVSGTATDAELAEVRLGTQLATLSGDSFTLQSVALVEGSNLLTVEAQDVAGNLGSASVTVILDTVAPVTEVRVDGAPLLEGAVFAGPITPEIVNSDATAVTVDATLDGAAYVSGTTIETEGAHTLAVAATDAAANAAVPLVLSFQTHQSPPALVAITPADGSLTAAASVTLDGQLAGASDLTVAGQAVPLLAAGDFITEPLALVEGPNVFALVATAANGLTTTAQHRIVRDSTEPALTVSSPAAGSLVGASAVDVSGTVSDAHSVQVVVNGVAGALSGSAFLARQVPLVEGENVLLVRAEDELGNAREISRTVHSDTAPPVLTFTDPAVSGVVVPGPTLHVAGTAADPHLDRVAVNGAAASSAADGSWSVEVALQEGENSLLAEAFDALGHRGEALLLVERDSAAPVVSIAEPIEGWATTAAAVDVRGTVADEPGVTVTVNGLAAAASGGAFEALAVPLADGENVMIARATDPQGNEGVDSLSVVRDNQPPSYLASDPSDGALALGANTVFAVTFSETLAPPAAEAYRLEIDDGAGGWSPLAVTSALDGASLRIIPSSPLPTQQNLRLVLTGLFEDPAGNALSNPTTLGFTTADTAAPAAPAVTAPAPFLCAQAVTLTGTSEPGSRIEVAGGAVPAFGVASAGGGFSLSVELLPGLNALSVIAIDSGGNLSPATAVEVVRDCQPPRVQETSRQGDDFRVVFDEAVQSATVSAAVSLRGVDGPIAGSVSASPAAATFTPSAALPAGDLLLEVATQVGDLAGNTLAYPYSRWFEESLGESFFSGTVIDDATGRPLAGVRVSVTATGGVATSEPRPELTTDASGRLVLATAAGTHDVTFARQGYSPVFRIVTTQAGSGAEVFDPRLTPVGVAQILAAAGGEIAEAGGVELTVPPGALPGPTELSVTAVSEQGLPALLPYGWSPRAAAWIAIDPEQVLATAATLRLPVSSPDGTLLTVAALDLGTLQWRALATATVAAGAVTATVDATGAYAVLERDVGVAEPMPGEVLTSLAAPSPDLLVAVTLSFNPELVLPNQRSRATVSYQTSEPVASGLPLTLEIQEQLELLDGSQRNEAPYRADLVLYRDLAGDHASSFWLQPSAAARSLPVRLGSELVVVETYADEGVRGNVLGPSGGTVIDQQGDVFEVPTGALAEPTAVVLHRRALADLPLPAPRGVAIDGVLELELELPLVVPGTLSYALATPPTGELGVLLSLVEIDGQPRWRAQAALEPAATGWTTSPIDLESLPWPGVTEAGIYAFARYTAAHGYAWGVMTAVGGSPVDGGVVSSGAVDWVQLSDAEGRYVLPLPADGQAVTLRAENPATGNVREQQVSVTAAGEQVELALPLQIVAPGVVSIVPGDGVTGVPLGVEPAIDFTEPVAPSTLAAGIELLWEGVAQPIQFAVQGTLVRVLTAAPLRPETWYTLAISQAVHDLQGYSLLSQHSVTFQTAAIVLPDSIDPRRLRVVRPDPVTGLARVEGLAGAVPGEVALLVENTSRPVPTVSLSAGQDGSFALDVEAQLEDRLQLTVLIEGTTAPVLWLPPFLSADLRSAYVGPRAESFTTGESITVTLVAETFDAPTWVRIESEPLAAAPRPAPDLLPAVSAFALDFGGATARHPLQLRLPAPAGAGAGPHLLNRFVDVLGHQGWMMHDLLEVEDGFFVSSAATTPLELPSSTSELLLAKTGGFSPGDYTIGVVLGGFYQVTQVDGPLGFLVVPLAGLNEIVVRSTAFGGGAPVIGLVNRFLRDFMPAGLLMPTLLNVPYEVTVEDLTTGYELFRDTLPAAAEPVVELPPDLYGDTEPPVLLAGSPLRFYHLLTAAEGITDLGPGLSYEVAGTTLSIIGAAGTMVEAGGIGLLGLDSGTSQTFSAAADGGLSIQRTIARGHRYLLALEGRVHTRDAVVLEFNEALPEEVSGIRVRKRSTQQLVDLVITARGTRATQVLAPANGWSIGDYQLELTTQLADGVGNAWPTAFSVPFSVVGSSLGDSLATGSVQDVAVLGSLLFVATLEDGLRVVDASHPGTLRNYLPNGLGFTFPLQEATRGVAVDPHGRVYVTGGGAATFGQLKILDPQAIDLEAIAADPAARDAAFRGSTLLSDPVGGANSVLPAGYPRRLAVMSNDDSTVWTFDPENPPAGVTFAPASPPATPEYVLTVTVTGSAAQEGLPITLRNRTRGTWYRVDAGADGGATFELVVEPDLSTGGGSGEPLAGDLRVRPGEQLELLRNLDAFAYVAIEGLGLAVIDANAFYGEDVAQDFGDPNVVSQVLSYYPGYPVPPAVCDPDVAFVDWTPLDLGVLLDVDNPHPLAIPTLIHRYGLGIMEATSLNAPDDLRALSDRCAAIDNRAVMGGMAVLQAYPMDLDGDGTVSAGELRDYVVVTNASVENGGGPTGWVMVFDVTDRALPLLAGRIELPSPVSTIVADRHNRRLYVAALGFGLHVVDFDRAPSLVAIDADGDGTDDRVVESIAIDQESVTQLALAPELGLIFAGGQNVGVNSITVAPPRLTVVAADGGSRSVARVAPFGVPTAAAGYGEELPGRVRIEARLPGGLANAAGELRLDLVSEGPGGLEIDGAGDPDLIAGLPPTSYRGGDGLVLRRLSDRPYDEGYGIFVSEPIVLIADLRASAYYRQTPEEENVCRRCDLVAEGVYSASQLSAGTGLSRELLSGHRLAVRFAPAFRIQTGELYGSVALDQAEIEVASVPWDIGPAVRQEPRLNPSYGSGDVAPGTLLHSGEMSMAATDLHLRGRGLDFAFTRTYRSQIVGGGPLGPGWDHGYRMRLRELPNGDVEYFDGRGRRELFHLAHQATGVYDLPAGSFQQLNRHESGWNIVEPSDTLLRFDRYGRLVSISDSIQTAPEVGTALEFSYDLRSRLVGVDAHGRWLKLGYDDAGRLIDVSDFSGREFHYRYDADGRLMEMETPAVATFEAPDVSSNAPLVTRYTYELADLDPCANAQRCLGERLNRRNNLETVTDPRGQTWLELTYEDQAGDPREEEVSAQRWGADTLQIDYLNRHSTRRKVTDRRGLEWIHDHNDRGQPLVAEDPLGTGTFWEYNEQGSVTAIQLPSGRKLHYTLDSSHWDKRLRGNVLLVKEEPSDGSEPPEEYPATEVRYGAANRPEWIKDPKGKITEIELLDTGLARKVSKDGVEIRREFNDFGQVTLVVNGNGNDTKYEYFEENPKKGLLKRVVADPEDLALTTTYEYDARGNRLEVTSPRGVRHQFVYNALDWLIEEKWAVLTSSGELEPIGHRVRYSHDRNGNVTQVEQLFGETSDVWTRTQVDYGQLNEVLETREEVTPGIADWVIERFGYDEDLNLIEQEGPDGQLTRFVYDERNHLSTRMREITPGDPGNLLESFVLNAIGQPELRTDARGEVWQITYDGYDRPREWLNPLGHKTEVGYDKNSNPVWVKVSEADGRLLSKREQSYDTLQRPEIETRWLWQYQALEPGEEPAAEPPSDAVAVKRKTVYDSASNAIEVWDPLNRITRFGYDSAERLIRIEDPAGNVTDLDLDAAGNAWRQVVTEQTPSGAETVRVTAFFDGLNRQTLVSDQLSNTTYYYYDPRGNLIRVVDAEGNFTSYAYDGLDRQTRATRPEGIEVTYAYDASSRLVEYRDALDNVTTWSYDVFDRQSSVAYADGTTESYEYDPNGNPTKVTKATGTVINQGFDGANRLATRTIEAAEGEELLGPTAETFGFDALDRALSAHSFVLTERAYDSLSRMLSEKTGSRILGYGYDVTGSLVSLSYPSGRQLTLAPDALSRPQEIGWSTGSEPVAKATYGYRGANLLASRDVGDSILGMFDYDSAGRLDKQRYEDSFQATVFGERTAWTPRGLKASQSRLDLNHKSMRFSHDDAGRLVDAEQTVDLDVPLSLGSIGGVPGQFLFSYDAAQNLTAKSTELVCEDAAIQLPLDGSGRNRPGQMGDVSLAWNSNGNLASKDQLSFHYDYRDRLSEVRNGETLVAAYAYDAFDRRIARVADGVTEATVWSAWQPIETYRSGQLSSRRTYGPGLDEVVSLEHDVDGDGILDDEYVPFYDSTGNLVLITDVAGKPIERYTYSPYGQQWIQVDSTPPSIEQLRVKDGKIAIEMSEEILLEELEKAIAAGSLSLTNLSTATTLDIRVVQPVATGRQARRRFLLYPTPEGELSWPAAGEDVELVIPVSALKDLFGNFATVGLPVQTLTWPVANEIVADSVSPRLEEVCVESGGILRMQFSEELSLAAAAAEIQVDGESVVWVASADGYTLRSEEGFEVGIHTLSVETGPMDLAGLGLAEAFDESFEVDEDSPEQLVFSAPYPGVAESSTIANAYGFHGLPRDPETGLIYARHRYYDPETGRFISADPMGYVDGPSMHQFALNNPADFGDPLGLEAGWMISKQHMAMEEAGLDPIYMRGAADGLIETLSNPYVQGGLQIAGGCSEAIVGGAAILSGVGSVPGAVALAHGTDLCITGLGTMAIGETQDPLFIQGTREGLVWAGVNEGAANWIAAGLDVGVGVGASVGVGAILSRRAVSMGRPPGLASVVDDLSSNVRFDNPRRVVELGRVHSTDWMPSGQWKRHLQSVRDNGIQNPEILYVELRGQNYVVWGSNRLEAAKITGVLDKLRLHKIELPFRGYRTAEDVLGGVHDARRNFARYERYRNRKWK